MMKNFSKSVLFLTFLTLCNAYGSDLSIWREESNKILSSQFKDEKTRYSNVEQSKPEYKQYGPWVEHQFHIASDLEYQQRNVLFKEKSLIPFIDDEFQSDQALQHNYKIHHFSAGSAFIFNEKEVDPKTVFFTNGVCYCTAFILKVGDWTGACHQLSAQTDQLEATLKELKKLCPDFDTVTKKAYLISSYQTPAQIKMKELLDHDGFKLITYAAAPVVYFNCELIHPQTDTRLKTKISFWKQDHSYQFSKGPYQIYTDVVFTASGEISWHRVSMGNWTCFTKNKAFEQAMALPCEESVLRSHPFIMPKVDDQEWGDQKYIDDYPDIFKDVKVLNEKVTELHDI